MSGRLLTVSLMLAEKVYEDEINSTETYSLLSGITIKDLNTIEAKICKIANYRIIPNEETTRYLMRGDIEKLFNERVVTDSNEVIDD